MSNRTQVSYHKDPRFCYLGNTTVLRAGSQLTFSEAEVSEYIKCSRDVVYFAENYCKVIHVDRGLIDLKLFDFQKNFFDVLNNNLRVIALMPRQVGKTTTVAIWLLWYGLFHADKTIAILANKGAAAREVMSRVTLALENLPFFLQAGCRELNKGSITWENNSKIFCSATTGSSIRGKSVSVVYIDEAAFLENAEEFYESTYPVVTSGKDTRVIITSTPRGTGNLFHRLWEGAVQKTNEYIPVRVFWHDVPGRDEEFKRKTIANTSERQWNQEFEGQFVGSTNTLLESESLLALRALNPISEDFDKSFKVYSKAVKGRVYIMSVDPSKGRGKDYHVINVIDVSADKFKQVAIYRNNELSPLLLPDIIKKIGMMYNEAYAVIEANNGGDAIASTLAYELEYENVYRENNRAGFLQTGKTKRHGCSNLKDLIEEGKIEIVDAQTIKELSEFVISGDSYAASGKNHDDCVMSLVNFAYFIQTSVFSEMTDINLRDLLYSKRIKEISEEDDNDPPPVGFFDNGIDRRSMNQRVETDSWF